MFPPFFSYYYCLLYCWPNGLIGLLKSQCEKEVNIMKVKKYRPIKMSFNLRELQMIAYCVEEQGIDNPRYIESIWKRNLIRRLKRAEMYHWRKEISEERKERGELYKQQDKETVAGHPHFRDTNAHRVGYTYGVQDGIMAYCKDCDIEIKVQ